MNQREFKEHQDKMIVEKMISLFEELFDARFNMHSDNCIENDVRYDKVREYVIEELLKVGND